MAAATSSSSAESSVPALTRLAAAALCRDWGSGTPPPLDGLPTELCKSVWKEVRALVKRAERPLSCKDMYPFVRSCWRIESLDLCDAGKWVTDASLQGLACVPSLSSVRLTACRFISDDGLAFAPRLPQLAHLDVSWTEVGDAGVASSLAKCHSLTSINLTGLAKLSDQGVASILGLQKLERLALCATAITDAALDYLTYYTRFPEAGPAHLGLHALRRLELSSTRVSDTGVGKLVATVEGGVAYGRVFKQLEYLALSSTNNVTPTQVRQVRTKYGFDTPLPNAPRTLAKSNAVALDAQAWVLRLNPTERTLTATARGWEAERLLAYVAAYTKEMAGAQDVIRRLTDADHGGPPMNPPALAGPDPKRQRVAA